MSLEKNKNITPSNQVKGNLTDIEVHLDVAFNSTGDPIFVKDEQFRLLLVNDAFCKIFGVARKDIIGKTLAEKVTLSERQHFLAVDEQVLKEGKEIVCEEQLTTNGKQTKTILTRKSRFTDSKGNYFLVGVIHDITERKKLNYVINPALKF
jgi:PAS domain S-box-containing protein